jgi:flagellar basal body-associated protein FliL
MKKHFKMKKQVIIIIAIVVIAAAIYWFTRKKKTQSQKDVVIAWANTDPNATSRNKRLDAIEKMSPDELAKIFVIVTQYFATNTSLPSDLQEILELC